MRFHLPQLPYGHNELEPAMSADQLETHYFGHHKAYIEKLNRLISEQNLGDVTLEYLVHNYDGQIFDNSAQAWNHCFFWYGLSPKPVSLSSNSALSGAIQKKFGSLEGLKEKFMESAASLFGSGWTWLVASPDGELDVLNTQNADNPMRLERTRPLWTCDVWEHAYYIDYRNERKEYLAPVWKHINWEFVERNYSSETIPNMTRLMKARGEHMSAPRM